MGRVRQWIVSRLHLNLKAKITAAVAALVIILMSALAYGTLSYYKKQLMDVIASHQFTLISAIADRIDTALTRAHDLLIANAREMPPEALRDVETAQRFLDSRVGLLQTFDNHIGLFTPAGIEITESPLTVNRRGWDYSFRSYIKRTVATKKTCLTNPYISSQAHRHPVVMMTAPVFDGRHRMVAILAGSLDLTRDNMLGKIVRTRVGRTGYLYLTTADRTVIMHPRQERIFKKITPGMNRLYDRVINEGFEGTGETVNYLKTRQFTSFKRLKVNDWILGANYPLAEVLAPVRHVQHFLLIATAVGILLLFLVLSSIIRHFTAPLAAFTRHVEELPRKQGAEKMIAVDTGDEIGTLSRAFNRMVAELDEQKDALQKSEELYRTIFDSSNDAIFIHDVETGEILDVNRKMCELYGFTREEARGMDVEKASAGTPPYTRQEAYAWMKKAATGGPQLFEWRAKSKEDRLFWVEVNMSRVSIGGFDRLLVTARDITERKQAEEEKQRLEAQLRQAQKMEAVGQLAGGVAHDFNNILSAITGYGSLLQMKMEENDPLRIHVDHLLEAAGRAATVTHSLLAFSRQRVISMQCVDLNDLVRKVQKLLSRIIGEDIELTIDLARDESVCVMADGGQLEQVLMNLAANARDAMPRGGRLTICAEPVVLDEAFVREQGYGEPGAYAHISVTDTGGGMDEATSKRMFEPFFTTKEQGKGTGLGLAIVYGIVTGHKGYITVDSTPGSGTTFHLFLPAVRSKAEQRRDEPLPAVVRGGAETILLAEDDVSVRALTRTVLQEFGYRVIEAADGEEAVAAFQRHRDEVRLLLFDVIMPKMNGREAYDAICRVRPQMKVLFASGYTANVMEEKGVLGEGMDFIMKPIAPDTLLLKVREVLDRKV